MKKLLKIGVLLAGTLFMSCSGSDSDKVILLIGCTDAEPASGQIVRFEISTFTTDGSNVDELYITSFDPEYGSRELEVLLPAARRFDYSFDYRVPTFRNGNVPLAVKFRSSSGSGHSQSVDVVLTVRSSQLPAEYTDIVLHSPASGRADGFSLASKDVLFTSESMDDRIDLYIPYSDDVSVLMRSLRSRTGLRFVRAESFDYASATSVSMNEVFANSIKSNSADELAEGDVLIFGRDNRAFGVLKIVEISDYDGSINDCIIFNIKIVE